MTATRQLSILICVKDGAEHFPMALESLMRQTLDDFEVIVVDDASRDSSGEIANTHPVVTRVLEGHGLGAAAARNLALAAARGEYITYLDHDDLYHPRRVERIHEWIRANDSPRCFWTGLSTFTAADASQSVAGVRLGSNWPAAAIKPGKELELLGVDASLLDVTGSDQRTLRSHEDVLNWGAAAAPLVVKTDLLRQVGGFPTHTGPAEDVLMMVNLSRVTPIIEIDQPTYFYRLRSDSQTRRMEIPWPYLSGMLAVRFGGQHMTSDRAVGRGTPLPRDLVLEDLLAHSIARDGFNGSFAPLYHALCLLYPDRRDRRAIFRRIATELIRTQTPRVDRDLRRLRSALRLDRDRAGTQSDGEPTR